MKPWKPVWQYGTQHQRMLLALYLVLLSGGLDLIGVVVGTFLLKHFNVKAFSLHEQEFSSSRIIGWVS